MKLSTRARYGLRALLYIAEQDPEQTTSVRQIAEEENISPDYLEHLLHQMKNAGLVESIRGASGGFKLARRPEDIYLQDIFNALDEKILPVFCLEEGEPCPRAGKCKSRSMWDNLGELLQNFLSKTSLADAVK